MLFVLVRLDVRHLWRGCEYVLSQLLIILVVLEILLELRNYLFIVVRVILFGILVDHWCVVDLAMSTNIWQYREIPLAIMQGLL